jgi:hypothetical protein
LEQRMRCSRSRSRIRDDVFPVVSEAARPTREPKRRNPPWRRRERERHPARGAVTTRVDLARSPRTYPRAQERRRRRPAPASRGRRPFPFPSRCVRTCVDGRAVCLRVTSSLARAWAMARSGKLVQVARPVRVRSAGYITTKNRHANCPSSEC